MTFTTVILYDKMPTSNMTVSRRVVNLAGLCAKDRSREVGMHPYRLEKCKVKYMTKIHA